MFSKWKGYVSCTLSELLFVSYCLTLRGHELLEVGHLSLGYDMATHFLDSVKDRLRTLPAIEKDLSSESGISMTHWPTKIAILEKMLITVTVFQKICCQSRWVFSKKKLCSTITRWDESSSHGLSVSYRRTHLAKILLYMSMSFTLELFLLQCTNMKY